MPTDPLAFLFSKNKPFVIAGPCALEDEGMALEVGQECRKIAKGLGVGYVFKSSYDKANRSSSKSYRGPGLRLGLQQLERLKTRLAVPVLTDVHETGQVMDVAKVADVLQIPAFLCRQTDLLRACGKTGKVVNIKKGQFLAPWNMADAAEKVVGEGNTRVILTERGVSFGYNNLVVDFIALPIMRKLGYPVVFDATHSVQLPGGLGHASGGRSEYVGTLARAAAAVGVDGYFFEVHPNPKKAKSDGPNMVRLKDFGKMLKTVIAHDQLER
jgi:2-dehydro-3-deoxyphosphooctonate aldolase (KDO 8-P synthase)